MSFKAVAKHAPVIITAHFTAGEAADKQFFVADRDYEVVEVIEVHRVAGAASSTLDVNRCASGTAAASGTTVLASDFATDSTADTPVHKHVGNGGLATTVAARTLSRGQSLAADFTGTITAYEGVVQVLLKPIHVAHTAY